MTNEELEQEVKRLEEQITNLRIKILESKAEKKPYEVEVPKDIEDYVFVDESGGIDGMFICDETWAKKIYERGHAFKTDEEAEQYDRECKLQFKLNKWAEEHNEGWTPNWKEQHEEIYEVQFNRFPRCFDEDVLVINEVDEVISMSKLPYFKSYKIALEFIKEFRDEIIEVFC